MSSNRLSDIIVSFVHETKDAILYDDGTQKFWVPKSALSEDGYIQAEENVDGTITLTAPEHWLNNKGLI